MATTQALVVAPSKQLTAQQRTRLALNPITLLAIGAWWSTLVLPLSLFTVVLAASCAVLAAVAPASSAAHMLYDAFAKRDRRMARAARLAPTSFGQTTLAELTAQVDQIESCAPDLAARFDLEALLDRHVTLTLAYERAIAAVRMADRSQLEHIRDTYKQDNVRSARRIDLCERRLNCLDECEAKAEALADDLAVLKELVALIAQRAAVRDEVIADDIVERQLEELDTAEAARRQVAELK